MAVSVLPRNTYRLLARLAIVVLVAAVVMAAFLALCTHHSANSVKPATPAVISPINNPSAAHAALSPDDNSCARPDATTPADGPAAPGSCPALTATFPTEAGMDPTA
jgi:hypothetical protein